MAVGVEKVFRHHCSVANKQMSYRFLKQVWIKRAPKEEHPKKRWQGRKARNWQSGKSAKILTNSYLQSTLYIY